MKIWEIKPFLQLSYILKLDPNIPKETVWPQSKPRLFLVFHILHLSRKWPAGCGIWTREGNWAE